MPLAFESLSHGRVAFGFFNIETDMLLLERQLFFADAFCAAVVELAQAVPMDSSATCSVELVGWHIDSPQRLGNLHGAIAGVDLSGFIGASYARYPFPSLPEDFKQSPEGSRTQSELRELVLQFGVEQPIRLESTAAAKTVSVAEILFSESVFAELVAYVVRGGYPQYRDGRRPPYVDQMSAQLAAGRQPSDGPKPAI